MKRWWIVGLVIVALFVTVWLVAQSGKIRAGQGLRAIADTTDVDVGDTHQFEFKWSRDGVALPEYETLTEFLPQGTSGISDIPQDITKKGEVWQVAVRVYDGEEWAEMTKTVEVTISGWPPSTPTVRIEAW